MCGAWGSSWAWNWCGTGKTREPAPACASYVANRLRDRGILISTDGPYRNVLKIKPPMVFDTANAEMLAGALRQVLGEDLVRLKRCERP